MIKRQPQREERLHKAIDADQQFKNTQFTPSVLTVKNWDTMHEKIKMLYFKSRFGFINDQETGLSYKNDRKRKWARDYINMSAFISHASVLQNR